MTEKVAKYIVKHHKLVFAFAAVMIAVSTFGLTRLESGFGLKIWFAPTDPYLLAYEQYERDFGNDDSLIIIAHSPSGIFDADSVQVVKELTDKMWQISDVIRVDSISNHQLISNRNGDVVIEQIFPQDTDEALIARRKEETKGDEHIISYLISRDQTTAAIHAQLKPLYDKKEQYNNAVRDAKELVKQFKGRTDHQFHLAGPAALSTAFREISMNDLTHLTPLLFLIVMVILLWHFRSFSLSTVLVGILGMTIFMSFGIAGLLGIKFNSLTSCLPQILIAMTLAEGIHFMGAFFRLRNAGESQEKAALHALSENLTATFMTSFTTALGFITFATSDLRPVRELGIIASIAIMLCWFLTISLMPAILLYLPAKVAPVMKERKKKRTDRAEKYLNWVENWRWPIIVSWGALFIISIICCFSIEVNSDILNYFSKSTDIAKANDFMEKHFGGARGLEIVFDSGRVDGVKDPAFLQKVITFQDWVRSQEHVTKVTSLADIIEQLNEAIDDDNVNRTRLPASSDSVAQQLFLYSMSLPVGMGLNYWATLNYQKMRMKILWNIDDSVVAEANMDRFQTKARELGLNATVTGKAALMPGIAHHLITTFNYADAQALVMIILCMVFMFRSWSIGLLSMIPNVVPPAFSGALMILANVKYDVGTILVMSIVMGIAVDDTIHFLHNYMHDKKEGKSTRKAILDTFERAGTSILMTTVILVLGFGLGFFSEFAPYVNFGVLTAVTLAFALSADLMLLPAILIALDKKKSLHKKLFDS